MLIELTRLSCDHVAQQTDVVARFTNRIPSIYEQNAQTSEILVNQFNAKLDAVKIKLIHDIDLFVPQLCVLNYMDDCDRLAENLILLKQYCRTLRTFEEYEQWISKEEILLHVEKTTYPNIADIRDYLVPFTELIKYLTRDYYSIRIFIICLYLTVIAYNGVDIAAFGWTAHGSTSIVM